MNIFSIVIFFMIISGFFVFCSMRKHLLLTLLSMEYLSLGLFLMLFMYLLYYNLSLYFIMFFLPFVICEAAVGLGILVCMIRGHGSDNVSSLSILGW